MSFQAQAWASRQRTGDPLAKLLLLTLANYANEDGIAWPSINRLADDTEMHRHSVMRKLALLEEQGFFTKSQRTTQIGTVFNLYRLEMGSPSEGPPVAHSNMGSPPERPDPINEPVSNPPRGSSRLKTMPEGWKASEDTLHWATTTHPQLKVDHEAARFSDHARASGKRYADWDAAFRTWVSRSAQWATERGSRRPDRAADNDRKLREYLDQLDPAGARSASWD